MSANISLSVILLTDFKCSNPISPRY